jgi:hypothetical protein
MLSWTLIYQIGYIWLDIMQQTSDFFTWLRELATSIIGAHWVPFISSMIVIWILYFLMNFLVKNVFNAGLIHLIRAYNNQNEREYRIMSALTFWWKRSVKLAEYHSLLFWSKPVYIFYIFFWWYRFLDANWTLIGVIAIGFILILAMTRFLFEYAKYFIIVQDSGIFEALGLSLTMTIENIGITFRIFFSLILVYLREIVLLVGIFILPVIMSWFVAFGLAPIFLQGVFIILGLVYLVFLIIVSAMNSVIELFVESLWYSVFRENLGQDTHAHHDGWHGSHWHGNHGSHWHEHHDGHADHWHHH